MSDGACANPADRVRLPADPRGRLTMALLLAFGFASVGSLATLPLLAAVALAVTVAAGGARLVLRRLRMPALLAGALFLGLALFAGQQILWQVGPLRLRAEGLEAGLLVAGRLLAIVAVTLALLAPLPPLRLASGLRGLGLPALMADLALLTLRYLDEARTEIARARLARRLRGGRDRWRSLPEQGWILAAALIRAQQRAERLWAAMRLRGHAGDLATLPPLRRSDLIGVAMAGAAALATVALDRGL